MKLYETGAVFPDDRVQERVKKWSARWDTQRNGMRYKLSWWAIYNQADQSDQNCVGALGSYFHPENNWKGYVELAYLISADHWRKGYASTALTAVMQFIETHCAQNIDGFVAPVHPDNNPSQNLLGAIGFKKDCEYTGAFGKRILFKKATRSQ